MTQNPALQPLLHDRTIALRAPVQLWCDPDGRIGTAPIDGLYLGDTRLVDRLEITVDGEPGEWISATAEGADRLGFDRLHRELDGPGADPDVRSTLHAEIDPVGAAYALHLASRRPERREVVVRVALRADLTAMDRIKAGLGRTGTAPLEVRADGDAVVWTDGVVSARLDAPAASIVVDGAGIVLEWRGHLGLDHSVEATWRLTATDRAAVVGPASGPAPWALPELDAASDDRLRRWLDRALADLDALRLETAELPGEAFLAAGAPWFFTLFGRDSIWAARLLLPLGHETAASTLRVLAAFQGRARDPYTAEQPGKIMHELRRGALEIPGLGISLPPRYYGTVDATPLWVCLLHDAWRAGMPEAEVRALLPALRAALAWMRDFGDSDGDGLLEYVDETGHGLANQGWKDSGDSVQWRDGRLARGPIALCEVQGYAYEAAMHGADLLEALGADGGDADVAAEAAGWRAWAARLAAAFHERFWVEDAAGAYPAIALDADKHAVDSLTSNIGHLLGTGLLDAGQEQLVASRLAGPALDSGFGLRTLSTEDAGYWPLSYHGGSVWAHDTAIAVHGLRRAGFAPEARTLAGGLLAAAASFGYRMPELHSGDAAADVPNPAPYPAACRPQAWSAAAAVAVWDAVGR